jgi:hypothetical protein
MVPQAPEIRDPRQQADSPARLHHIGGAPEPLHSERCGARLRDAPLREAVRSSVVRENLPPAITEAERGEILALGTRLFDRKLDLPQLLDSGTLAVGDAIWSFDYKVDQICIYNAANDADSLSGERMIRISDDDLKRLFLHTMSLA